MERFADAPAATYVQDGLAQTGAPNLVTAVLLDFRAWDTLGEATVLFTSVIGAFVILRRRGRKHKTEEDQEKFGIIEDEGLAPRVTVRATAGSGENMELLAAGDIDLAIIQSDTNAHESVRLITGLYDEALQAFPENLDLRYNRALYIYEKGDFAAMEAGLREILAQDPDHVDALNALGYTLADRNERIADLERRFRDLETRNPDAP